MPKKATTTFVIMMTSIVSVSVLLLALVTLPNQVLSLQMTMSLTSLSSGGRSSSSSISSLKSCAFLSYSSCLDLREEQWENDDDTNSLSESNSFYKTTYRSSSSWLQMGKGDGKKRRPKKKSSDATPPSPQPAAAVSQPLRVTSDSNISVKRQIRWAQMKKEMERNSGTSFRQTNVKRTRFRKSLNEEEIEEKAIERKKRGQEPDWDVILNNTSTSPLVIVDGYNVVHQWPRLKKWMNKGMLSKARETLVHDLEELRLLKGWRIECVFDGFGRDTRGPLGDGPGNLAVSKSDKTTKKKVTDLGVRVVFSGVGASADAYIEERCFDAKQVTEGKITSSFIVASNDNILRMSATNAGALCMSSDRLIDELKAARKTTAYRVEAAVARANGVAMRPISGSSKSSSSSSSPSKFVTAGQFIIEDKRKKKKPKNNLAGEKQNAELQDVIKGTTSVPSWAIVPNNTKTRQ
mmetsp:Transcript_38109/g.57020  ORF Transcript_38109/g.57020 Transcript_38109/m.57020 type:complete len:464 (-) Transcript_38109:85-1476(-)